MNKELISEIKKIKRLAGINESSRTILLENGGGGRGGAVVAVTKWLLGVGVDLTSEIAARRSAILKTMLNSTKKITNIVDIASKESFLNKILKQAVEELEQKGIDDMITYLKSELGDDVGDLFSNISKYADDATIKKMTDEISDESSEFSQTITKSLDDEMSRMKEQPGYQKASKSVKLAMLKELRDKFQKDLESAIGVSKEGAESTAQKNAISNLIDNKMKNLTDDVIGDASIGFFKKMSIQLTSLPGFTGQLFNSLNTIFLSLTKNIETIQKEMDDIVALVATKKYDKTATLLLISRIKILAPTMETVNTSLLKAYDELMSSIKNTIQDDDLSKQVEEILGKKDGNLYKNWNNLYDFFKKINDSDELAGTTYQSVMGKIKEILGLFNILSLLNPWGKKTWSDISSTISDGLLRTTNLLVQGTLSSFKEYLQFMSSKRKFFGIGREVQGFGKASLLDLYGRIWFTANIAAPFCISFIFSFLVPAIACSFQGLKNLVSESDNYKAEWCMYPVSWFKETFVSGLEDTFSPLIEALTLSNADTELDNSSVSKICYEVFEMFIPFSTTLDSLYDYWMGNEDPEKVVDDAVTKKTKEIEGEIKDEIDPKLLAKKELEKEEYKIRFEGNMQLNKMTEYKDVYDQLKDSLIIDTLDKNSVDPILMWNGVPYNTRYNKMKGTIISDQSGNKYTVDEFVKHVSGLKESIYRKRIMENSGKKFGEDNFKHWKKTFTFFNFDNENGEYKEVKITSKMDEIMDTIDHYRKKYDEDDSFVRAVIDVFGDKIDRVSFNKDMAQLTESVRVFGLMKVLANIRESKELEIWTVKHYSDGNWELVKGSFNKKELQNVGKTVKDREKEQEERKKPVDGLKKKEQEAIISLKNDESSGLENLPVKIKEKVKEKLSRGWTTETPMLVFDEFYDKSEINSVFNEKIEIYKLNPTKEFLQSLVNNSARISLKRGFCKSLKGIKNEVEMNDRQKQVLTHFITKCNNKYDTLTKKYKPSYND